MGKRIGRRRFDEPRFGITDGMIEVEHLELQRGMDSYLLQSLTELRKDGRSACGNTREQDKSREAGINRLPERERLARMCIFGRDLVLLQAIALAFLEARKFRPRTAPFSEWLFANKSGTVE